MKHVFLSALSFILVTAISCSGESQKVKETGTQQNPSQEPGLSGKEESLAQQRLLTAMEEKKFLKEQNRAFAENYYELGKADYEKLKLESAKEYLQLALRYDPEHREASDLLEKVLGLLGERPDKIRSFMDRAVQERAVKTEQMLLEIENLISVGEDQYESGDFRKAEDSFRTALLMMNRLPYYVKHPERKNELILKLKQFEK